MKAQITQNKVAPSSWHSDEDTCVHCPLSLTLHLLACAYRQSVSSRRCNFALKPLVTHAYIPIIVSAPGTRQQRANRMTLKYLSPASLRRIKFGVGVTRSYPAPLCGETCMLVNTWVTHTPTHLHTHTRLSSFSWLCRLGQTVHVPSSNVEY